MHVWVVCCNDFPVAVFDEEWLADKFVSEKPRHHPGMPYSKLYWKIYKFKFNQEGEVD